MYQEDKTFNLRFNLEAQFPEDSGSGSGAPRPLQMSSLIGMDKAIGWKGLKGPGSGKTVIAPV